MDRSSAAAEPGVQESGDGLASDFACFGKLPGVGDFFSRRMPYAVQQFWDHWLADGMQALRVGNTASGWEFWRNTPSWAFVVPALPGVPWAQFGVMAPSCDRVGRNFPVLVCSTLLAGKIESAIVRAAGVALACCQAIEQVQRERQGVEALDAAIESARMQMLAATDAADDVERTLPRGMNPSHLPWPDLSKVFDPNGNESYWWSVPPASTGFRARIHGGALNSAHFLALCAAAPNGQPVRPDWT